MDNKKSVLYLTSVFLPPTETFVYDSIRGVKGYRKIVLTGRRENERIFPFPEKDIIRFPYLLARDREHHRGKIKVKAYNAARKLADPLLRPWLNKYFRTLVKENNIKVMHAHFGFNGAGFIRIKNDTDTKLVTSFHGIDTIPVLRSEPGFYDDLFREGDLMLAEGHAMKRTFTDHGYPGDKIAVHHLGIDVDKFPYKKREISPDEKVKILFVGRFVEKKGIDRLVKAFCKAHQENRRLELTLVGNGPEMPKIKRIIEEKNLQDTAIIKGFLPHDKIHEEMEKAHIFAHPSVTAPNGDTEGGTPTAILEAQAAGMPILSTFHADIPEAVLDGKSGLLCREGDADAIAENIKWLAQNPSRWSWMGRAGRKHVSREYNHLVQGKRLSGIYDSLL